MGCRIMVDDSFFALLISTTTIKLCNKMKPLLHTFSCQEGQGTLLHYMEDLRNPLKSCLEHVVFFLINRPFITEKGTQK